MKVRCPHCQVIYNIPSSALEEAGHKVVCSECHNVFEAPSTGRKSHLPQPETDTEFSMDSEMEKLLSDLERSLEGKQASTRNEPNDEEGFLLEELDLSLVDNEDKLPDTQPLEAEPAAAPEQEKHPPTMPPLPGASDQDGFTPTNNKPQGRTSVSSILLAILLATGATAQIAWLQKDRLLANPQFRELTQTFCSRMDCHLPPAPRKQDIHIVDRLFEPYQSHPGAYRLDLLLRNDGQTSENLPALQLSLLDDQQQVMARRTIPASAYATEANSAMKPGQTREIHLLFLPPSPDVSGFELGLLPSDS